MRFAQNTLKWVLIVFLAAFIGLPLLLGLVLLPFFGPKALGLVFMIYINLIFLIIDPTGLGGEVNFSQVLESGTDEDGVLCSFFAVELKPEAQAQPYAIAEDDYEWTPEHILIKAREGRPEKYWYETPLPDDQIDALVGKLQFCGMSAATADMVKAALSTPGSWVGGRTGITFDLDSIYSKPQSIAVSYSHD